MANHKSAEKRNRQRINRTGRNRSVRTLVRSVVRRARAAVESGDEDAAALVTRATKLLDRAGSKNAIPKIRTARLKSRLVKAFNRANSAGNQANSAG